MNNLDPSVIAATAGVILSLLFNYIPGLNTRFDRLSPDMQRFCMGVMIVVAGLVMAVWQCVAVSRTGHYICGTDLIDWRMVLTNIVSALIGNQSADRISPKVIQS